LSVAEAPNLDAEVPDDIYLSALDHARSPEELAFRDVLVFHRDALNGGLDQALDNKVPDRARLTPFLHAYRLIGLNELAVLIRDAHEALLRPGEAGVGAEFEELSERYVQLTYGAEGDQPDAVERHAIAFARSRPQAFANVLAGIGTGAAKAYSDQLVAKIEVLARRLKEES
jgi:hypothetical protein